MKQYSPLSSELKGFSFLYNIMSFTLLFLFIPKEPTFPIAGFNDQVKKSIMKAHFLPSRWGRYGRWVAHSQVLMDCEALQTLHNLGMAIL